METIKDVILFIINRMIKKEKRSIFCSPLQNCFIDKYDLINFTSDTVLTFINYIISNQHQEKMKINLIIYHPSRIDEYKRYVEKVKNISFNFIISPNCFHGVNKLIAKLKVLYFKFKSIIWIHENIPALRQYADKSQHQVILGYYSSCKSDYDFDNIRSSKLRRFCKPDNILICSTSYLDSIIKSAAYGVPIQCFREYGLTRNDLIKCNKSGKLSSWFQLKQIDKDTKIILYAPTYRDYEDKNDVKKRSIWGVGYNDCLINDFLKKHNMLVIAKLHPWQNRHIIRQSYDRILIYEPTFEFSYYDLMPVADIMITDYSSIGLDWLYTGKPIIFNLWDLELYRNKRGLAYEPYEEMCGGEIVHNTEELVKSLSNAIHMDIYEKKRNKIFKIMFKENRDSTCKNVYSYICNVLNNLEHGNINDKKYNKKI